MNSELTTKIRHRLCLLIFEMRQTQHGFAEQKPGEKASRRTFSPAGSKNTILHVESNFTIHSSGMTVMARQWLNERAKILFQTTRPGKTC